MRWRYTEERAKPDDPMIAAQRWKKERDAARGTIDSILEAIKGRRFKDDIGLSAETYVRYTLDTAGHLYHVEGYMEMAAERDRYKEALERIAYPDTFVQSQSRAARVAREALDEVA